MCYSGLCFFEAGGDHAGDCQVGNHDLFAEKYGISPCLAGGLPDDPDTEAWQKAHKDEMDEVCQKWLLDRYPHLRELTH